MVMGKVARGPFLAWLYDRGVRLSEYGKAYSYFQNNTAFPFQIGKNPKPASEGTGKCIGSRQWAITPFNKRDSLYALHSSEDVDSLSEYFLRWKDDPGCRWHAIVKPSGEMYISTSLYAGYRVYGKTVVERAQRVAARRYAELVLVWPGTPQYARYHKLRHTEDRQAVE